MICSKWPRALSCLACVTLVACSNRDPGQDQTAGTDSTSGSGSTQMSASDDGSKDSSDSGELDSASADSMGTDEESDSSSESGEVDCSLPQWPDDIVVDEDSAQALELDGERVSVDEAGQLAFICGRGGLETVPVGRVRPRGEHVGARLDWYGLAAGATCRSIEAVGKGRALVLSSSGQLGLFAADASGALELLHETRLEPLGPVAADRARTFDESAYDMAVRPGEIAVALGSGGIVHLSWSDAGFSEGARWSEPEHIGTRAIAALAGDRFAIADEGGDIRLLDGSGTQLQYIERARTGGATRAISDGASRVAVLRGGKGFDLLELEGSALVLRGSDIPLGSVADLRFLDDGSVLLATGSELARLGTVANDDSEVPQMRLISVEPRTGAGTHGGEWFRALSKTGPVLALTQSRLLPLNLGAAEPAPILSFDRATYMTATRDDLPKSTVILSCVNRGEAPLLIDGLSVAKPFAALLPDSLMPREGCEGQFYVQPRGTCYVIVTLQADPSAHHTEYVELSTDDPNKAITRARVEGNRPPPKLDEPVIDMAMLSQSGRLLAIEDYRGSHLLMKVFNTE